jgi:Rne/Rng family ribonuclease
MSKELVISATPHETRVAIVEDGLLCEIYIEREKEFALVGSLYKGRVTRVLPGMQSAFVDIGLDSDAFLYVGDFLEHLEDYDHAPSPAENKGAAGAPPGRTFAPATTHGGVSPDNISEANPPAVEEPAVASLATPVEAEAAPAPVPPSANPRFSPQPNRPPYEQNRDRNRGNSGGRGGKNRRWGRPNRDRRPGRDLPPSKYASNRPSEPQPAQGYEPPAENYVPVILPGESLAKYKDRPIGSAASPASSGETMTPAAQNFADANVAASSQENMAEESQPGFPSPVYSGAPVSSSLTQEMEAGVESGEEAETGLDSEGASPQLSAQRTMPEPRLDLAESSEVLAQNIAPLSEEDVSALAEQLAEAKHEEAQAEAENRDIAEDTAVDAFVDAAEMEDLQEALHHEEGISAEDMDEDAAEEDSAAGDGSAEMHAEAMRDEDAHADELHLEALQADEAHGEAAHGDEMPDALSADSAAGTSEGQDAHGGELADASGNSAQPQQPNTARISDQSRARFQRPMRRGGRGRFNRRGGRPNDQRPPQQSHSHGPRHEQHRRPQLISEMLKAGEEIIVQIAKEPLGKKGARITSHVALPGRYLVYMPTVDHIGVSRRIGSAEDRSRLRRLVTEAKGTFPGGFIVRTAAGGATDEEIRTDVEFLGRTWDTIRNGAEQRRAPALLHRDLNLVERILRDYLSDDYVAIWIDNQDEFTKVVEFVGRFQPRMVNRVKLYTKDAPIFEEFGIQQELDKALRPKVWLKSGGYIVINHTEALVAIDVNTGKYVGRGSTRLEDTIVKTNLEAVKEIVRQIRLRDLGGIIVADFIDMEERRNREKVMAALEQALSQDRAPSKALSFNEFGLVCITRKRTKQALERVLCQPCPYCTGSGMVKSIPTICYEIQAEARKMSADLDSQSLTLRVNPEIAKTLKTRESSLIEELEQATRKSIIIQSDPTLHWEQYDIY